MINYNKRPVQYVEWVDTFNSVSTHLSHLILYNLNNGVPLINKRVFDTIRRLDRINKRINIEHAVMDSSYIDILMKAMKRYES